MRLFSGFDKSKSEKKDKKSLFLTKKILSCEKTAVVLSVRAFFLSLEVEDFFMVYLYSEIDDAILWKYTKNLEEVGFYGQDDCSNQKTFYSAG